MKLLLCPSCSSIFNLRINVIQSCFCGKSSGEYVDNINATYYGKAIPLGFDNNSFMAALRGGIKNRNISPEFTAFFISETAETVKLERKDKK